MTALVVIALLLTLAGPAPAGEEPGSLEGAPVERIDVRGVRALSGEELSTALLISSGMTYSEPAVRESCSRLLRLYADAGYPWAGVRVYTRRDGEENGLAVLFSVEEGRRAKISEVSFTGNEITRTEVLDRQLGIEPGDPFSLTLLESGRRRLAGWGIYDEIESIRIVEDENPYRVSLVVPVRESKPNRLAGAVGFGQGDDTGRNLWGNVHFRMNNILGTARRFEIDWAQTSVDEKSLAVGYREPWIGSLPLSGEFSYRQRLRENRFMQVEIGGGVSSVLAGPGRIGIGFVHERTYPHGAHADPAASSTKNGVTASLSWTSPEHGDRANRAPALESFSALVSYGSRREQDDRFRETVLSAGFELTWLERGAIRLKTAAGTRTAFRDDGTHPLYLTVPFGGTRTVRGHRDGEYDVFRAFWTQNELRFFRWGDGEFRLFVDQALIAVPAGESTLGSSHLTGFGAGITSRTAAGVLALDLALSPGEGLGAARLHVGLREEF